MRWSEVDQMTCSVARTLAVVGDRWTLLVLRDCFLGLRRFDDFQRDLGLTRHRLADRLARLVEHGVLERAAYQERPARFEYRLTEKGRDLYPVMTALLRFGDRWLADADGAPLELIHRGCGAVATPTLACPECGELVSARDMQARPGPALRALARRNRRSGSRITTAADAGVQGRTRTPRAAAKRSAVRGAR
jgi:DNA-binding HxlR family transcriptional regulator